MYTIESMLTHADDVFYTSRLLTLSYQPKAWISEMFLLHWSIELYLKAFLMNHDVDKGKINNNHDLLNLYCMCLNFDRELENIIVPNQGFKYGNTQTFWIKYINPFNNKKGGIRYPNKNLSIISFPIKIHESFDKLITNIRKGVDPNKVIDKYLA